MADRRPALGRGLSALIPDVLGGREAPTDIDIDLLTPNRFQPRAQIDDSRLDDLAKSIKTNGVIQPIVVRRSGERYEIVAGERRWRAAARAGVVKVPVVIRDVPDDKLLAVALIENVQREDLNPIDEAAAYRKLIDDFHFSQEQIADAVGKDRSSVANYVRLLKLPDEVRGDLAAGALSMGHARALLGLPDAAAQRRIAREVVARGLSVRETEGLIRRLASEPAARATPEPAKDVHTRAAEERLRFSLGTRVRIVRKGKGGRIEIDFTSEEELQRVYERLTH